MASYLEDIIIFGDNENKKLVVKNTWMSQFQMKDLGLSSKQILGIRSEHKAGDVMSYKKRACWELAF